MRITQSWTSKTIADRAVRPPASRRQPIFVTGLPRSGTTLVQQILSAHSKVDGGREFNLAVALEATMDGFGIADFDRYLASGGTISDLRDLYLRLVHERLPGEGYFVDKTLQQSRSLGPFSALFPDAPVIWLRRDPMDQAWAIYRTWLGSALASWSFEEIAEHLKLEDRLRTYWQGELGDRMLSLEYSDLVADPDVWIERITRHCGLEPEERQARFHENSESVSTASAMQVREPINRKGIGSAEPFREYMQPFLDTFYGTGDGGTGS